MPLVSFPLGPQTGSPLSMATGTRYEPVTLVVVDDDDDDDDDGLWYLSAEGTTTTTTQ